MSRNLPGQDTAGNSTRRWKPTVEQKAVLESIYRQGIHSPTLDEIERITKQLQAYGEVEEKNVFYWFQNFTAREKQLQKNKKPSQLLLSQREAASAPELLMNASPIYVPRTQVNSSPIYVPRTQFTDEGKMEDCLFFDHSCSACNNVDADETLELFPLRPHGGLKKSATNH